MMTGSNSSAAKSAREHPRSLPVHEWPDADRRAWEDACRPGSRLKPGGAASYLAPVSRDDFARRYGAFLGFLQRNGRLERDAAAAAQVTLPNVEAYITDLTARVRSVTVYNCIYKLRRAAELLAPTVDFSWLAEIEKDLALVMEPRSKFDRLVSHGAARGSRPDIGGRSAGVRNERSRPRPRRAQRPHDRAPRALPNPAEEFCGPGDRADIQGGSWQVVDRLAGHQHEISPAGRASRPSIAEPLHRPVSEPIATRSPWVKAAHKCPLDLLHDRPANDHKESRDLDLQDYS